MAKFGQKRHTPLRETTNATIKSDPQQLTNVGCVGRRKSSGMTCCPQGSYSLNPSILKQSDPHLARIVASQTPVAFHSDESDDEVAPSHMGLSQSPDCVLALFDPDPEVKNQPRRSQQQWLRYSRVADGARNAALKLSTWLATQAGKYHGLELEPVSYTHLTLPTILLV